MRSMQDRMGKDFSPERVLFRRSIGAHQDWPGVILLHALRDAAERKATDIHISGDQKPNVRFRIDGNMESWRTDLEITSADTEVICETLAWTLNDVPWRKADFRCGLVTREQLRALPEGVQAAQISLAPLVGDCSYAVITLFYEAGGKASGEDCVN